MTQDKRSPELLRDDSLDQVIGGASCQNNLKQIGIAFTNTNTGDTAAHSGAVNVALGDGSVRFAR